VNRSYNTEIVVELLRRNPELYQEVEKQLSPQRVPVNALRVAYLLLFPYATVSLAIVMSLLISAQSYAGALAAAGPFLASVLATLGFYRRYLRA